MKTEKQRGKRRMVYARLSTSEKWNALDTDTARLLYIMLLVHTDDMGHMDATARVVKMVCVPGLDWSFQQIDDMISNIVSIGLGTIYDAEGRKYLEITDFDQYQKFSRERTPLYPQSIQAINSSKSDILEPKDKVSKVKESKDKLSECTPGVPPEVSIEYKLSGRLFNAIQTRNPGNKKPDLSKWASHVGFMIRIDKRDPAEIEKVIDWCQQDTADKQQSGSWKGWANNILSTETLREKYDKLILKMNQAKPSKQPSKYDNKAEVINRE